MTDEFDDILRSRLRQPESSGASEAQSVLGQLQPAMRRARFRRAATIGAATLSLLAVSGVGLAAVADSVSQEPAEVDILIEGDRLPEPTPPTSTPAPDDTVEPADEQDEQDEQDEPSISLPTTSTTVVRDGPAATEVAPSTSAPSGPVPDSTQPRPDNEPVSPPTTAPVSAPTTAPTTAPATAPTNPQPTTSSAPTTTIAAPQTPTTAAPPATVSTPTMQRTIQSNCGSITVSYSGNTVTLTGTQPGAGFVPDIKNSGPEKVEVGFENGSAECEIKAEAESGELRTDVENDDGEEDLGEEDFGKESDDDDQAEEPDEEDDA